MSNEIVIRANRLAKRYRLGERQPYKTLRDTLTSWIRLPLRACGNFSIRTTEQKKTPLEFWALDHVSFKVARGEVLGLIGRNGAGKSTLLKVLSRITEPTSGSVEIFGRVGSLLEVGSGFHPELTGRENIFLYGAILGMNRREILSKFDQIVDFSETGRFLDMPIKHYSSGMYTRLAFSVAAHLEPEILLVDEVLAVGDAAFQRKCLGRMGELAHGGRTVVFVSHNMGLILQLCSMCLRLEEGRLVDGGPTQHVVNKYLKELYSDTNVSSIPAQVGNIRPDPAFKLRSFRVLQRGVETSNFSNGQPVNIEVEYDLKMDVQGFHVYIQLMRQDGTILFESLHDGQIGRAVVQPKGRYLSIATIPGDLLQGGRYVMTLHAGIHNVRSVLEPPITVLLDFFRDGRVNSTYPAYNSPGLMLIDLNWTTHESIRNIPWPDTDNMEGA